MLLVTIGQACMEVNKEEDIFFQAAKKVGVHLQNRDQEISRLTLILIRNSYAYEAHMNTKNEHIA
jgi:hypothetical protein